MTTRARNWMITKYQDLEYIPMVSPLTYWTGQLEQCPSTERIHLQAYLEFGKPMSMIGVKKFLKDSTVHCEVRKGSQKQAIEYVTKVESRLHESTAPFEFGEKKKQGERTDIEWALEKLREGNTVLEVVEKNNKFLTMHKHLEWYKSQISEKRNWKTEVIVLIGPPGCGKTRKVYEENEDIYNMIGQVRNGSHHFMDGYTGQDVVLMDDFEGEIDYRLLLKLTDRYPMDVHIKGGTTNWKPRKIFITSNLPVKQWYPNVEALERRITQTIVFENGTEEVHTSGLIGNTVAISPNVYNEFFAEEPSLAEAGPSDAANPLAPARSPVLTAPLRSAVYEGIITQDLRAEDWFAFGLERFGLDLRHLSDITALKIIGSSDADELSDGESTVGSDNTDLNTVVGSIGVSHVNPFLTKSVVPCSCGSDIESAKCCGTEIA